MRLSTGLVNKLMDTGSFRDIFSNAVIDIYSGVQPTLPDSVPNGTLLVTVTNNSGAYTTETRATGSMTLTGGTTSNTVNTITVNGIDILGGTVTYDTSLSITASAVADQINRNPANLLFTASAAGAVITITAVNGLGALPNGWVVTATLTGITATYSNMAGGVASVNGLRFGSASAGVLSKLASQTWSGTVGTTGIAGWFRLREVGDSGTGLSTTACRVDGTIGTSGADMNLGTLSLTATAPFIIPNASFTLAQQ